MRLQREYELLELPVNEIATLHQRGADAILHRLLKEGFIDSMETARGYVQKPPPQTARSLFSQYLDSLLKENKMSIKEIIECVNEKKINSTPTPSRRVLRHSKAK